MFFPQRVLISLSCAIWKEFKATIHVSSWALWWINPPFAVPSQMIKVQPWHRGFSNIYVGKKKSFLMTNDSHTSFRPSRLSGCARGSIKECFGLPLEKRQPLILRLWPWWLRSPVPSPVQSTTHAPKTASCHHKKRLFQQKETFFKIHFLKYSPKLLKVSVGLTFPPCLQEGRHLVWLSIHNTFLVCVSN